MSLTDNEKASATTVGVQIEAQGALSSYEETQGKDALRRFLIIKYGTLRWGSCML
jgi:hypothetical protein